MNRRALLMLLLLVTSACATLGPHGRPSAPATRLTFAEVPIVELRAHPANHVGDVFQERFTFFRVWWNQDRARPHQIATELPTHFEARIVAAPLYVARIEFPPGADALFEPMREGTELCLQVRFLRLHPASASPVFAFEQMATGCAPNPTGANTTRDRTAVR